MPRFIVDNLKRQWTFFNLKKAIAFAKRECDYGEVWEVWEGDQVVHVIGRCECS